MLAWIGRHPLQRGGGIAIFALGWLSLLCR